MNLEPRIRELLDYQTIALTFAVSLTPDMLWERLGEDEVCDVENEGPGIVVLLSHPLMNVVAGRMIAPGKAVRTQPYVGITPATYICLLPGTKEPGANIKIRFWKLSEVRHDSTT